MKVKEPRLNKWLKDHIEYFEELLDLSLSAFVPRNIKGGRPDIIAKNGEDLIVFENQLREADKNT